MCLGATRSVAGTMSAGASALGILYLSTEEGKATFPPAVLGGALHVTLVSALPHVGPPGLAQGPGVLVRLSKRRFVRSFALPNVRGLLRPVTMPPFIMTPGLGSWPCAARMVSGRWPVHPTIPGRFTVAPFVRAMVGGFPRLGTLLSAFCKGLLPSPLVVLSVAMLPPPREEARPRPCSGHIVHSRHGLP